MLSTDWTGHSPPDTASLRFYPVGNGATSTKPTSGELERTRAERAALWQLCKVLKRAHRCTCRAYADLHGELCRLRAENEGLRRARASAADLPRVGGER